jgi:hypothetical protein
VSALIGCDRSSAVVRVETFAQLRIYTTGAVQYDEFAQSGVVTPTPTLNYPHQIAEQ